MEVYIDLNFSEFGEMRAISWLFWDLALTKFNFGLVSLQFYPRPLRSCRNVLEF